MIRSVTARRSSVLSPAILAIFIFVVKCVPQSFAFNIFAYNDASPTPSSSPSVTNMTTSPTVASVATTSSPSSPGQCSATLPLRSDLTFTYGTYLDDDERVIFTGKLVYEKESWIAVAVSKRANGLMFGGEAIIGLPSLGNVNINPGIYDLGGYDVSTVNLKEDVSQTLFDHSIEQTDLKTTLSFSRYLDDPNLFPIHADKTTSLLYAAGSDNDWGVHAITGAFRIDLSKVCDEGGDKNVVTIITDGKETMWQIHGMFAGLAWAVATPLAVISAMVKDMFSWTSKDGKFNVNWFNVHMYMNMASILFTIASFAVAVKTFENLERDHFTTDKPHHVIGLVVFVLASAQVIGAFLRPHIDKDRKIPPTTKRKIWKYFHKATGVALVAMGFYQIFSGFGLYAAKYNVPNYSWIFGVWLGVMAIMTVVKIMISKRAEKNNKEDQV